MRRDGWRRPLLGAGLALLAVAAWGYLVTVAIAFGRSARDHGGAPAWLLTIVATLGAAACLAVVFVLLARGREMVHDRARREPGRHR